MVSSIYFQHFFSFFYSGPSLYVSSLSTKLGIPLPNPAPDIEIAPPGLESTLPSGGMGIGATVNTTGMSNLEGVQFEDEDEPKKKKYAKEAWPGKKPTPSLLG